MPRQDRVKALLVGLNTGAYGTDPVPDTAIRAFDFGLSIDGQTLADDPVQPYMGAGDDHIVGRNVGLQFSIRAVGAGTAGTAPPYGALLRMCGLSETVTAATDVTYEPVSKAFEDGALYYVVDGKQRALLGARGTVTLTVERSNVPMLRFEMRGLYAAPTDGVAMPAVDWSTWPRPKPAEPANTPTFTFHGHSPKLLRMEAALGQAVEFVPRVNDERVDITNRASTGSVTIDEPDSLATKDYEAAWVSGERDVLRVVHGTTAGNIVEFVADKARITSVGEGQSEGRVTQQLGLSLKPDGGNDEWRLIVR
ncbi:hypothetical protein [Caenispirillum bisanense]|uniref:Uncharacterized protein n=1 Tax=Caenispirillum bisanense TaxID=414052 RepID=A0A286GYS8_9PROT|nr:hypothetical protein [Caenispirillum bisanense]SOE00680.1 hypothetical protein SAMN05421508_11396 [Caenispirillum bisanense]